MCQRRAFLLAGATIKAVMTASSEIATIKNVDFMDEFADLPPKKIRTAQVASKAT